MDLYVQTWIQYSRIGIVLSNVLNIHIAADGKVGERRWKSMNIVPVAPNLNISAVFAAIKVMIENTNEVAVRHQT